MERRAPNPFRVLIVEDSDLFREILRGALNARFPHVEVLEADDLAQARNLIRGMAPNLVFLDIQLPGGNGLSLAPEVFAADPRAALLVCTTHNLPEYREAAFAGGATHFVPKGDLGMGELMGLVAEVLEERSSFAERPSGGARGFGGDASR